MNTESTLNIKKHYWRKDITGLRAVAVLPVLLYHAFPSLLPGGFFGVDIFFIISGYLIAGIIFRGLIDNNFSYCDFYVKRIKRILPNLVTLLLAVALCGWFVLTTEEYKSLGRHIYSSAAFYQNFRLLSDVDYFDLAANEKPLLHLWSLAIEEQFYIVFPIICTLVWSIFKRSSKAIGICVLVITLGSLTLCLNTTDNSQRFYFPLSRFWELGIGIIIAYAESFYRLNTKNFDKNLRNSLSALGLLMIAGSFFFYDTQIKTPGLFSLLPTLGAALLIFANDDAVINRSLLSWKLMTFIGLISYSLYLWHWPLIAYLTIVMPKAPQWYYGIALLMSFPISVLVYSLIENPIRRMKSNSIVVSGLLVLLIICIGLGQLVKQLDGFPQRGIAQIYGFTNDFTYHQVLRKQLFHGVKVNVADRSLPPPEILFVGDSHIQQYAPRAKLVGVQHHKNVAFLDVGGCLISNGVSFNGYEICKEMPAKLKQTLQAPTIKTIVIGQIWGAYQHKMPEAFQQGVDEYIELIQQYAKNKKVFILLDPPWDYGSYDLKKHIKNRFDIEGFIKDDFHVDYPKENYWQMGNLYVEEKMSPYAEIIKTEHYVCPNKKCNLRFYKDDDHLRSSYVEKNAFWIDRVFQ